MGNLNFIEVILIGALIFVAFSKKVDDKAKKYILMGLGLVLVIILFTGGLTSNGTAFGFTIGGVQMLPIIVIAAVAFVLFKRNQDGDSIGSSKYLLLGLAGFFLVNSLNSTNTL